MFNLTRFPECKVLMKVKRGLPLSTGEEFVRDNKKVQEMLEWEFRKFIIKLEVPLYNGLTNYNFHDTLNAFVKLLFAQQHKQDYEERCKRIEYAYANNTTHLLPFYDKIKTLSP